MLARRHCPVCVGVRQLRRLLQTSAPRRWDEYDNKGFVDRGDDPFVRVWETLTFDHKRYKRRFLQAKYDEYERMGLLSHTKRQVMRHELVPFHADILIVGGGIIGSSIAWWMRNRIRDEDTVIAVVECDDTFSKSSTVLSLGGIHQQWSLPENVDMSLFGAEFLRHAGHHLRILNSEPPEINFQPMGHLFLATDPDKATEMEKNWKMQTDRGAKVALLTRDDLRAKFPFISSDDVHLASFGLENEGVVDSWQFLSALREANATYGICYVKGRVERIMLESRVAPGEMNPTARNPLKDSPDNLVLHRKLGGVFVRLQKTNAASRPIHCGTLINACGPWSGKLAELAGIGKGTDLLSVPIPVQPKKRYVYVVHCPDGPGLDMPYLIDPSGVWCRREDCGHIYLCGKLPTPEEDAAVDNSNLDVDFNYFYDKIWPLLAARVPAFEKLKVKNAWAGYYDDNYYDGNPLIGPHIGFDNFFQVSGFSGRGIQHAIAAGRGVMEYIYDSAYETIPLRKFGMERMLRQVRLQETTRI